MTKSPVGAATDRRLGTLGLTVVGVAVAVLGVAWWAFDANPARGETLLLLGATAVGASRVLRGRLTPSGQRVLLSIVVVLGLVTLLDAVHLVQVVNDQTASHLA